MSETQPKPVTMSMIWTYLLFTVHQHAETSPAVERARHGIAMGRVGFNKADQDAEVSEAEIAEQMAREHFPSGMSNGTGWQFYASGKPEAFWDVFQSPYDGGDEEENCPRLFSGVCEFILAPLSPTDPAHVAMVARALALSFAMPCGIMPVGGMVSPDFDVDTGRDGVLVTLIDHVRPAALGVPFRTGAFLPGATIDDGLGTLLFRWFTERHTEIASVMNPPGQTTSPQV